MATNREAVTRLRSTPEEKAAWFDAAVRSEAPNVSTWIRFHLNAAADADLRVAPVVEIVESADGQHFRGVVTYADAVAEHELEPIGRSVAADLTEKLHADGTLPEGLSLEFETAPYLRPLASRTFRGPDPKPTPKAKKDKRR